MSLSRDAILGLDDAVTEKVYVPEWGDTVLVRGMSGTDRDRFESSIREIRATRSGGQEVVMKTDNARAQLLVKCLVDEAGERIFKDTDAEALGKKNGAALDRLYDVAARLSGLSEDAQEEAKGNSDAAQSGSSTTSSPETSAAPSPSS
jgi:hypothetical protein